MLEHRFVTIVLKGERMKTNLDTVQEIVEYIDAHLEERLDLDSLCKVAGYSKYHLGRMFSSIVGFSMHTYIQRRRLTEAARLLIFTNRTIMDIALFAGYETQQSFTVGFKALFKCSPQAFRKKRDFYPFQLKYSVDGIKKLRGDMILNIQTVDYGEIFLVGYKKNTRFGFFVIGQCWRKLHAKKNTIMHRANTDFLIGFNDYSTWDITVDRQPAFDYYAASEVLRIEDVPRGMNAKRLPATKYIVFSFRAKSEDSLEPVVNYIYKEWFPQSTSQLNEAAKYDFARYSENVDENGKNLIEYWVPII